tara:strand:+ start:316 stop:1152 length:837 start_codon:yes stop_codon:yes gene_type:complete
MWARTGSIGDRRCAAEGCNALEFRSEGWCQRHRGGNDPILPATAPNWWEEQPEGAPLLATPPLQPVEEEEYSHIRMEETEEKSIGARITEGVLGLFFIIAIFSGALEADNASNAPSYQYDYDYEGGDPGSGLPADTFPNPWSECAIVMYDAWWTYHPAVANDSGNLAITWDADIDCDIAADMYATISIEAAPENDTVRVLTKDYATYSNNWDNVSVFATADGSPGRIVDGTYTISILVTGTHNIYRTNAPLFLQAAITVGEDSTTGSLCTDHPCGVLS